MTNIIIGLGNKGDSYKKTRHNVGFMFLDFLFKESSSWNKKESYLYQTLQIGNKNTTLVKPTTMMNRSGEVVRYLMANKHIKPEEIIIAHDDIDLPVGSYKISSGKGSGGHNGVGSIINLTGTQAFTRLRIGIAPISFLGKIKKPKGRDKVSSFVLSDFSTKEQKKVEEVFRELKNIIESDRLI